ncbi:MAG: class I SAM-dependent methyltransferase [Myxococcota bacterium]
MLDPRLADNLALWDSRVRDHVGSGFYDLRGFLAGADPLTSLEDAALGSVDGLSVLHLMCHFGLDSLALARRGARVTGVDFAPQAVEVARAIAARTGLPARFVESEVTQAPAVLEGEGFDRVFSSWGVTCWLPDLDAWARAIAACLVPGGAFHLLEVHPMAWVFLDPGDAGRECAYPVMPYQTDGVTVSQDVEGSYASDRVIPGRQHLWHHGVGRVVTALAGAGLVVERLIERDVVTTPVLPALVRRSDGLWTWRAGAPALPLSYEVCARRPEVSGR